VEQTSAVRRVDDVGSLRDLRRLPVTVSLTISDFSSFRLLGFQLMFHQLTLEQSLPATGYGVKLADLQLIDFGANQVVTDMNL
jgi:hypothetical protein